MLIQYNRYFASKLATKISTYDLWKCVLYNTLLQCLYMILFDGTVTNYSYLLCHYNPL